MSTTTTQRVMRVLRGPALFVLILLTIEFMDEFVFGARESAWPLIRTDLNLSYEQIGLLLALPALIASLIEPMFGILGHVWKRRILILGGGVCFTLSLLMMVISHNAITLLIAFIVLYPASGAFVALSQTSLMDVDPNRHEQNMARWTFAGSVGVVAGTVTIAGITAVSGSWRLAFAMAAILTLILVFAVRQFPFGNSTKADNSEDGIEQEAETLSLWDGIRAARAALKRPDIIRWLIMLEFGNLLHDILYGYLALYFVDVVHVSELQAGIAVTIWTVIGLIGSLLVIPLLDHVQGITYVRFSALLEMVLYALFLLIPGFIPKVIALAAISLFNDGWYSVLQGQLYSAMPGQSSIVLTLNNISGLLGSAIPFVLGLVADRFGLDFAMWLLIIGPIVLLIGLPRKRNG